MKVILTGATGYVGEGVMLELLRTPQVEKVHWMLACSRDGYPQFVINPRDITKLAKRI